MTNFIRQKYLDSVREAKLIPSAEWAFAFVPWNLVPESGTMPFTNPEPINPDDLPEAP